MTLYFKNNKQWLSIKFIYVKIKIYYRIFLSFSPFNDLGMKVPNTVWHWDPAGKTGKHLLCFVHHNRGVVHHNERRPDGVIHTIHNTKNKGSISLKKMESRITRIHTAFKFMQKGLINWFKFTDYDLPNSIDIAYMEPWIDPQMRNMKRE